MTKKSFYYIKTEEHMIDLTLDMLDSGPLPIIWDIEGMYVVLQKAAVENVISWLEDVGKSDTLDLGIRKYRVHWDDSYVMYEEDYIRLNRFIEHLTT